MYVAPGKKTPTCYVFPLVRAWKGVRNALEYNTRLLKTADPKMKYTLLCLEFERFQNAENKRDHPNLFYRLHWSGDVFDMEYADALVKAMQAYPKITFWAYTRSFFAVPTLATVPNLKLYLSLDAINFKSGLNTFYLWKSKPNHGNVQLCYLTNQDDFNQRFFTERAQLRADDPGAVWDTDPPKLSSCPVDSGKLPLEGGCAKCQKCLGTRIGGAMPILFLN
jgi:hypothetical protein